MPLIIDTYNVLHVVGVLPPDLAGIDTEGLIRLLEASRYRSDPVLLACDGRPGPGAPTGKHGHVTIRYSGPGVTADELIGKLVRASSVPRRLTVVSSDRAIVREARRRRCRTLTSEAFLRELATDGRHLGGSRPTGQSTGPRPQGSTPLSEGQVEEWLGTFELGDGSAPIAPPTEPSPEPEGAQPPEPRPIVIPLTPAPTIMPADLLAEAEDLVAEAEQTIEAEPSAARMAEVRAEAERAAARPTAKKDEPPGPPATPALVPREILDQAERLVADPRAAIDAPPPPGVAGSGGPASPPDEGDEPRRRGPDLLPDDILAEAESMLRDAAGEDEPDAIDEDD